MLGLNFLETIIMTFITPIGFPSFLSLTPTIPRQRKS
jgi:hypothetical protein